SSPLESLSHSDVQTPLLWLLSYSDLPDSSASASSVACFHQLDTPCRRIPPPCHRTPLFPDAFGFPATPSPPALHIPSAPCVHPSPTGSWDRCRQSPQRHPWSHRWAFR